MISSALTGMLNSLTPVFTLVIGLFLLKQKVKRQQVLGIFIGLAGAVGLLSLKSNSDGNANLLTGAAFVVLATFFYGLSVNIIRLKLGGINSVTATVFAMCIIGPVAGAYLFTTDFIVCMHTHPHAWASLGFVAILAIFGTALSVMVYNLLIKEAGTLFAASVTYVIPIVAIGWGISDHETVTLLHLVFILVILGGVRLVNKK